MCAGMSFSSKADLLVEAKGSVQPFDSLQKMSFP
jgi:hypothetical protein